VPATSYYPRRSARDSAWRKQQLRAAAARAKRRREADVDAVRAANAAAVRLCRQRHAPAGLTLHELWERVGGDRMTLAYVLRNEFRLGRVDYRSTSRRYLLNGELDARTRAALAALAPVDRAGRRSA
jgi:hypothetical protein